VSWPRGREAILDMLDREERPTSERGHLALQRAIEAHLDASMGALLRPVSRIRTTRHAIQYPDTATYIDADQIRADLPAAVELVSTAVKAVPHLPVFTR
jgi:hypothetical protein